MTDSSAESRKTDFLAIFAEEVAWRWVQPLQEVGPLTCLLADTIDDLLRSTLGALNIAPEKAEENVCAALGCASNAALDTLEWQTGSRALGLDRSGYSLGQAGQAGAQRAARALLSLVPVDKRSILEAGKPKPQPAKATDSGNSGGGTNWLEDLVGELAKAGATPEHMIAVKKAFGGAATGAIIAPPIVIKTLRDMIKVVSEFVDEGLKRLEKELDLELIETRARAVIARQIAAAGASLDIGSNRWLGVRVHQLLQDYYIEQVSDHDVVAELPVSDKFSRQAVYGPIARARGDDFVYLEDLAWKDDDPLLFFGILHSALAGYKLKSSSQLRADVVDRNLLMIWEIKPVLGAEDAVWQEFFYRRSFNVMQATARSMKHLKRPVGEDPLKPGDFWPTEIPVLPDIPLRQVNVPKVLEDLPQTVIPFQLGILPGIVLYLAPKTKEATEAIKTFLQLLAVLGVLLRKEEDPPDDGDDGTLDKILEPVKKTLKKGKRKPAPANEEVWRIVEELRRRTQREISEDPTGSVATGTVMALVIMLTVLIVALMVRRFGGKAMQATLVAGALSAILVFVGGWAVRRGSSLGPGDLPPQGDADAPGAQGFQMSAPRPADVLGSVTDISLGPIRLKDVPIKEVQRLVREIGTAFDSVAAGRGITFTLH